MKILIAEDDAPLQKSICLLLSRLGHTTAPVENAVEAIQALESGETFDAVITDMHMPGSCGIELLQHMWRSGATPPTYVHSAEPTFFFYDRLWNLSQDIPKFFGDFASFRLKDSGMMRDITEFIASIEHKVP